jgi:hypothetical protein
MEATTSARFFFDSLGSAAEALLTCLLDARKTDKNYRFGQLKAEQILLSGMLVTGQITDISLKLEMIPGVVRYEE